MAVVQRSMTRFFGSCSIISVNIANGSKHNIWCRVIGDKEYKVEGATGGGVDVHDFKFHAYISKHVYHTNVAIPGYSEIQIGNTLEFELRPSSKSVCMTVINKNDRIICENHEITRSRNYIIDHHDALLNAKKNKMWIDTKGRDHEVFCSESPSFYDKQCGQLFSASNLTLIIAIVLIVTFND